MEKLKGRCNSTVGPPVQRPCEKFAEGFVSASGSFKGEPPLTPTERICAFAAITPANKKASFVMNSLRHIESQLRDAQNERVNREEGVNAVHSSISMNTFARAYGDGCTRSGGRW